MYDIENYYQAESVKDAVRLLNEHPDARIISGGSADQDPGGKICRNFSGEHPWNQRNPGCKNGG